MEKYIGAIDQGTSSSRFLVFKAGTKEVIAQYQVSVTSKYPKEGWVEQDPIQLLSSVQECMLQVRNQLEEGQYLSAIGITNQRESTIVWDRVTGKPLHNAIIWLDTRTQTTVDKILHSKDNDIDKDILKSRCGLPISTYFSALKLRWLLDNVPEVQKALDSNRLLFGTVDSWLIWNLSGGVNNGVHITDVTNASRTMLMDLQTLDWDDYLCEFFSIPKSILPQIRSSSEIYCEVSPSFSFPGVPVCGCLGDQQAALVGQGCFRVGMAKNTYGTGCFMLYNVGDIPVVSSSGLLTTVAYQFDSKPVYALEGSIAIAGAAINWLRDNLGIINSTKEVEPMIKSIQDTGGVIFVPAFSGLLAPHWRSDARGTICGLTQYHRREHIVRAAIEAVCFQTKEVLEAMQKDSGTTLKKLLVDGGMATNDTIMQIQADILGISTVRPFMTETTALGAAMAAGHAIGIEFLEENDGEAAAQIFTPIMSESQRNMNFERWKKAVEKSLNWAPE